MLTNLRTSKVYECDQFTLTVRQGYQLYVADTYSSITLVQDHCIGRLTVSMNRIDIACHRLGTKDSACNLGLFIKLITEARKILRGRSVYIQPKTKQQYNVIISMLHRFHSSFVEKEGRIHFCI